jgi:glycosyltransferase involved in cell wall biosynthesis
MASQPRLTYITTSTFPIQKASSVQVMQMCAAFAEAGALVKLVARQAQPAADVFEHYGIKRTFIFSPRPFPNLPRPTDVFQAQAAFNQPNSHWICYSRGSDLTAPFVALWRGAQAIVEAHGRPVTARQRWLLRYIARHPRGRLVVISQPLKEIYLHEFGLNSFVAPDGVDLTRFTPPIPKAEAQTMFGLGEGPWVVYVGGLYAGRGLETLFEAVAGLPVKLLIVGGRDENEIAQWREKAQTLGVTNIRFEGYQLPARVPLYLFAADVLAMPYSARTRTPSGEDTTKWMSPLKLYEYLGAGRPIVSSDLPALRTVLTHEQNALLSPPDDAAGLRASIQRLVTENDLADRLAHNARQSVQAHTWLARAKAILGLVSGE